MIHKLIHSFFGPGTYLHTWLLYLFVTNILKVWASRCNKSKAEVMGGLDAVHSPPVHQRFSLVCASRSRVQRVIQTGCLLCLFVTRNRHVILRKRPLDILVPT